jgi:4-hydroxy-4-methyl-2-oxoglutarate aldolase
MVEGDLRERHGEGDVGRGERAVCAGAQVSPGDVIVADEDGVVVIPRKDAADVAVKGEKRFAEEDAKRQKLASGILGLDMYNMREPLAKAGLVYVDDPDQV